MTILRFPSPRQNGGRPGGPADGVRTRDAGTGGSPPSDARMLMAIAALNRPILAAVVGRREKAQRVLAAFQGERIRPRPPAPHAANDTSGDPS